MEENISSGISPEYLRETSWNTSEEGLNSIGKGKVDSLKERLEEIGEMIKERKLLSAKFIKEGENMKLSINNFLVENTPKGENDSEFVRERSELRKKQIEISEIQLNEKINCWRDIALLKKELRDNTRELNEKESRNEMIGRILRE